MRPSRLTLGYVLGAAPFVIRVGTPAAPVATQICDMPVSLPASSSVDSKAIVFPEWLSAALWFVPSPRVNYVRTVERAPVAHAFP